MILGFWLVRGLPKTRSEFATENRPKLRPNKRKLPLPTIRFQRVFAVSFREGVIRKILIQVGKTS